MRNKLTPIFIGIGIIVIFGGVVAGLFVAGKIAWVNPDAKEVGVYKAVCSDRIIADYNDAMFYKPRGDSTTPTLDTNTLEELKTVIARLSGSNNDPTCQTILFWIAVNEENYENAKPAYDNVKRLHDEGLFADSNLSSNQPLSSYEGAMYSFSPAGKESKVILGDD